MTALYFAAGFFLAAISVAALVPSWLDDRRAALAARRLAAAEHAFWVSLQALVDAAREDIDAPLTDTPIFERMLIERMHDALAGDDAAERIGGWSA